IGQGTVAPSGGVFYAGDIVQLTANPADGWGLARWIGTDYDFSTQRTNFVTMVSDTTVTAVFEPTAVYRVPDVNYPTIQSAINAAKDGDSIIVERGTYLIDSTIFINKAITLASANPDDPCEVLQTIIDGQGYPVARAIYITSNCGPDTVIHGLTIRNFAWSSFGGFGGFFPGWDGSPGGPAYGAGIYIDPGAGPTIVNCVIGNIQINGGPGGGGAGGAEDPNNPTNPWLPGDQHGGNGGSGGAAYGGGIYCGLFSSPIIRNCRISDCTIQGGNGGAGGVGVSPQGANSLPSPAGGWGGNGGQAGGAYGGGICVDYGSSPQIERCTIVRCSASAGNGGVGGNGGTGTANFFGGRGGNGGENTTAQGGGIYFASTSTANVSDCTVSNCSTTGGTAGNGGNGGNNRSAGFGGGYLGQYWKDSAYGGAVHCGPGSVIMFDDCTFSNNTVTGGMSGQGGSGVTVPIPPIPYVITSYGAGVFCDANSILSFADCDIIGNAASNMYVVPGPNAPNDPNDPNYIDPNSPPPLYRLDPYISYGGGICSIWAQSVLIVDSSLSENYATVGGGSFWSESGCVIADSSFASNSAFLGGGTYNTDSLVTRILGCTFTDNIAEEEGGSSGGAGGGLVCLSTPGVIEDCQFGGNFASGSGGGAYLGGSAPGVTTVNNCLVTSNMAGRDGGGISCDWYLEAMISNCTIADNRVSTVPSFGGGLYCSYGSNVDVIDCIIWGNSSAYEGSQVAVAGGDPNQPQTSTVSITYSDVQVLQGENGTGVGTGPTGSGDPNRPDYFIYGEFDANLNDAYGLFGWVGSDDNHRIMTYSSTYDPDYTMVSTDAYIYTVSIGPGANPHAHPNNPYAPGPIAPRTFTLERTFDLGENFTAWGHSSEFHVDPVENVIYVGARTDGILKYVFDPCANNPAAGGPAGNYVFDSKIAPECPGSPETLAYDPDNDIWYAGTKHFGFDGNGEMWKYDGAQGSDGSWELAFVYTPPVQTVGMHHHDGLEFVNGHLFVATMYGDSIQQYTPDGILVNVFTHEPLVRELESMGWGALWHFWVGSFTGIITEFGGGALQQGIERIPVPPIYVEQDCTLYGWEPDDPNNFWTWDINSWDPNTHNIDEDPCFVAGYYLSQPVLELPDLPLSPCVDTG
ncbi:MAG: InlB B-repeat-containing protein, partial [Planctomycetota bacterium]